MPFAGVNAVALLFKSATRTGGTRRSDVELLSMTTTPALTGRPGHNAGQTFPAEVLTLEEVDALVAAASSRSSTGIRSRALILVLHRAGLRVSEALALRPADIDVERCTIRVLRGKGGKARTVALDPGACAAVGRWMDRRAKLGVSRRAPVFCTLDGAKAIYATQVRTTLQRLADRAGLDKRVHPHGLRHAHAAHLDRSGVPVSTIQRQLGHASLSVTTRYLAGLGEEEHLDRVRKVGW